MTRDSTRLARLLPTDPGYAPFGWRWLRGLNLLPFALFGFIGLVWTVEGLARRPGWHDGTPLLAALAGALSHLPVQLMLGTVAIMPLMVPVVLVLNVTEGCSSVWRIAGLTAAVLIGALLSNASVVALGCAVDNWPESLCANPFASYRALAADVIEAALFGALAATPLYIHRRQQESARALRDAKLQRLNAQREETEGRLRSLQAQIEPHFLFNTLAHIFRLHQVDARRGRLMLRSLIDYMRSALPQMREPDFTLGRELALTRAYVNVQQIRMGDRLRVEIDVPAALMDARLPPMMVLTLAENAVKHGLSPKREGGTLRIGATLQRGRLEVVVCDDGVGLRIGAGTGHGLSNTRSRLSALFGPLAALDIGNNDSGGVRAALSLPFRPVAKQAKAP